MNIIHLAFMRNDYASGVRVVVPQIIYSNQVLENTALFNFGDINLSKEESITLLNKENDFNFDLDTLPTPFNKPDIVVFHGIYSTHYISVAKLLTKKNIPYVVFPHGSLTKQATNSKWLKKKIAHLLWFNTFIKNASAIQYLTDFEKQNSPCNVPSFVLPNGIKVKEYSHVPKFCDSGIRMVFIGRKNIYHKGLDVLLLACKRIAEQLKESNVKIELYGPDNDGSNKVERLIKDYKLQDIVYNFGPVYGKEKKQILQTADLFLLPSRFEGHSVGLLEAMAEGVPVLVTPGTGNTSEVLENKCGWAANFNEVDLSRTLTQIISEVDRFPEYSRNAYDYVKNTYSWDLIGNKMVMEYRRIVDNQKEKN